MTQPCKLQPLIYHHVITQTGQLECWKYLGKCYCKFQILWESEIFIVLVPSSHILKIQTGYVLIHFYDSLPGWFTKRINE